MFPCTKCGKNSTSNAGRSAHERHCKAGEELTDGAIAPALTQPPEAMPEPTEEPKEVIRSTASVVVREMKGWKLLYDTAYHVFAYHVIDNLGRTLGSYEKEEDAIRFLENSSRWIR